MQMPWEAITAITGIIALIVGALLALLVQRVRYKFQLTIIYLAPYRKWCADFHGELDEFWRRYLSSAVGQTDYSNVQIIDDWRALHEAAKDGPKWLAKMKKEAEKEDEKIVEKLDNLLSTIDRLWHESEEKHNVSLKDRFDIINLGKDMRGKMANDLWNSREEILTKVSYEDQRMILTYLGKRIP